MENSILRTQNIIISLNNFVISRFNFIYAIYKMFCHAAKNKTLRLYLPSKNCFQVQRISLEKSMLLKSKIIIIMIIIQKGICFLSAIEFIIKIDFYKAMSVFIPIINH